jgi:hypothetical protein
LLPDGHAAQALALDIPVGQPRFEGGVARGLVIGLVDEQRGTVGEAHLDDEAGLPSGLELALAGKAQFRAFGGRGVIHDISVRIHAVIPDEQRAVHLAGDLQRDGAVSLAGGRGFQFGDAGVEIAAAFASKIGGGGRLGREGGEGQGSGGKQRQLSGHRLHNSPDPSNSRTGGRPSATGIALRLKRRTLR